MEQLLLVLFILFSIVSSLLERRKRRQQLEEAQEKEKQRREAREAGEPVEPKWEEDEEEEDAWSGWPLPGGDPFERPKAKPAQSRRDAEPRFETEAGEPVELESVPANPLAELQQQVREAEARARQQEAEVRQRQQQALDLQRSAGSGAAAGLRLSQPGTGVQRSSRRSGSRASSRYRLTPTTARRAVVYAEILGPCKAERGDEERA